MSLSNGWSLGTNGFAQYKLMSEENMVAIRFHNLVSGSGWPSGTVIWATPTAYQPTVKDAQSFTIGGGPAGATVTFRLNGSMEIEGLTAGATITGQGTYNID